MRAYLRLDPELNDKKADYPDGAFAAFVDLLCCAEQQPHRGRFKSLSILRAYMGRRARWVPFLLDKCDLTMIDGTYYVDGWDEWQEGDWKVAERVRRIRSRSHVTVPVTVPVTIPPPPMAGGPLHGGKQIATSGKRLAVSGKQDEGTDQKILTTNDSKLALETWTALKPKMVGE